MRSYLCLLLFLVATLPGCARPNRPGPEATPALPAVGDKIEVAGLHNVLRVTAKLYSGSGPAGDVGFGSLRALGIRTVISVDGVRPDVERARRHGLRYVHLPIGYDGVPEPQALRLAKAVRDLPGPVYLHCHHGQHRGPAAVAVARLCLEEACSAEAAVDLLRRAGTDARYTGLYAAPRRLRRPTPVELDRLPADFPEVAAVAALAQVMVAIDRHWEHLQGVRAAGWRAPPDHPDLDPPHEALQLAEQYHEAGRLPDAAKRPAEFRRWLEGAEEGARELETVLRQAKERGAVEARAAEQAFRRASAACARCHAKYRDVPQGL